MVFSSVPRSLLLLSLAAQALAASDPLKPSITYFNFSTLILPRATGLDSTMRGSSSTPTISSLPTTLTTIGSIAMPTKTPKPEGPMIEIRGFKDWLESAWDDTMSIPPKTTSAPLTALRRDAVATAAPESVNQPKHVKVDQDKVAVESIAGRSLAFDRRNYRRSIRSESQPGYNDNVKRDLGGDIEKDAGDYAEDHGFHVSKRETVKEWLKDMFSGGQRDNGMNGSN